MKITKIGHYCLIVEVNGKKIMTDPGSFSTEQTEVTGVDFVLITHEHWDHIHVESLKKVLENNPNCMVVTNSGVKKLLDAGNIPCKVFEDGEENILGIDVFAQSCEHADIYDGVVPVLNTGYLIDNKFFIPGDAWVEIRKKIDVLAVPVMAPWLKVREVMNYATKLRPRIIFPIHDGGANEIAEVMTHKQLTKFCAEKGLDFKALRNGETLEV
jgi:L-ascorbate metabolism protein UlaG (beta-lactamase superfamily)